MTQISRPFQIALAAMVLLVAVWFVALRGHSAGSEGAGSAPSAQSAAPSSAPAAGAAKPSSPGSVYHGSAPGVEGLTRVIAKARGAVAQSQQNAQQLKEKSAQASNPGSTQTGAASATGGTQAASSSASHGSAATSRPASKSPAGSKPLHAANSGAAARSRASASMQPAIERELKQGKVAMILFWNPKGSVDVVVRRELQAVGRSQGAKVAVHVASSNQVGSFGSFTRAVQVYGTPTILIVNKSGQTSTVTGLTDVFSIEQAIKEAKRA